jgi:hypothetical protein
LPRRENALVSLTSRLQKSRRPLRVSHKPSSIFPS